VLQMMVPFRLECVDPGDRLFRWMEGVGERVCYGRGAWIHYGHDASDAIYLICRGRVGVASGEGGVILEAGDLFGELFFDDDGEFRGSYLARALEESEVLVMRRERVRELLGEKGLGRLRGLIGYKRDLVFLFQ